MGENDLLIGWKRIAAFLGCSERSIRGKKYMLMAADPPYIFCKRQKLGKSVICAWADDLKRWAKAR
jgi:hypothetical protein